ncbi:MAG: zinc dependent phospholipase C family protein [Gammaproteobacteria bacterium]|nr:zinc dependent phospholipase C family protein [Gammaproteobacteria bacterium]
MPGAYAHMTLVNHFREPQRLEDINGFPVDAIIAILDYFKFCELGCISPDYPYLAVGDAEAAKWSDLMHYVDTGRMIHAGITYVQTMNGPDRSKALAWLLGYTAHVVMDVTIHPVVELKVGPYHDNKNQHRVCEMHQDAYIFQRMNLGDIGLSEYFDSGIAQCSDPHDKNRLDPVIRKMWQFMLKNVHATAFNDNQPDINKWHKSFYFLMDKIVSEGNKLRPLSRHMAVKAGLTYPAPDGIDDQFIKNIETPDGVSDYDFVFDRALENVGRVWAIVAKAVLNDDTAYMSSIGNWNLDTGRDPMGTLVMWEAVA